MLSSCRDSTAESVWGWRQTHSTVLLSSVPTHVLNMQSMFTTENSTKVWCIAYAVSSMQPAPPRQPAPLLQPAPPFQGEETSCFYGPASEEACRHPTHTYVEICEAWSSACMPFKCLHAAECLRCVGPLKVVKPRVGMW